MASANSDAIPINTGEIPINSGTISKKFGAIPINLIPMNQDVPASSFPTSIFLASKHKKVE